MNLLIVDDEYYSAEGTKKKIAQKGPLFDEIFCAYNMTQALEYLAGHSVAIMILDIEMPGGSGLELLDHIRQQGLDTICIFLTAYAKFEYISKAMRLTSIDYLLKPVAEEDLLTAVAKAVNQYRQQANASWRHSRQITGRKVSFICGSCSGWIYQKELFPTGKRISSAN